MCEPWGTINLPDLSALLRGGGAEGFIKVHSVEIPAVSVRVQYEIVGLNLLRPPRGLRSKTWDVWLLQNVGEPEARKAYARHRRQAFAHFEILRWREIQERDGHIAPSEYQGDNGTGRTTSDDGDIEEPERSLQSPPENFFFR